ncbi:MAG: bifunctional non-ous end joining protein LigD [Acidobacteriota bacterium]|jgi:bifunctional non-homologous end joining protein LigD|nr:bifunctional non-ous end joining protein LigD [Acidobacteriota bacterium]
MALQEYKRKRDFKKTPEPAGKVAKAKGNSFVIQKHAATRLHYDFRLEMEGVLRSWAVPKGPSLDPGEKRLAVHVEDHPLDYGGFEGIIPKGQYGGGTVLLWDHGTWYPEGDPVKAYKKGHIKFRLEGEKLHGGWHLVRLHGDRAGEDKENWLLFKDNDDVAVPGSGDALTQEYPKSVTTGLTLEEIAANPDRVWQSNREEKVAKKKAPAKKAAPPPPPGARKAKLPAKVAPQLATLVSDPPQGEEWIHELKFDGYRVLCELKDGKVRIVTRNGKDWTDRFGPIVEVIAALPAKEALLDGEAAVLLPNGTTSFQALQNALGGGRENLVFFAFDLLHLDGYDLRPLPLLQRKEALTALLAGQPKEGILRLSDHVQGAGEEFYRHACDYALEGIISKRGDQPYRSGRGKDWVKVKCLKRQEMVIVGFTDPEGSRTGFGALLLAVNEGKDLVYAGKVGTGFNAKTLTDLRKKLGKLERETPAFKKAPRGAEARRSHWVEPKLVAEVAFTEWTEDGILRHPTFQGLREDKSPGEVVREVAQPTEKVEKKASAPRTVAAKKAAVKKTAKKKGDTPPLGPERDPEGITEIAGVKISNPDRVLYPEQGLTKRELALFYERIQAWILPHLKNRPLTMVRCPSGQGKQCFYQKHVNEQFPASIKRVQVEEGGAAVPYGAVDSLTGLIYLVQMGVLELHIWGSHIDDIEKPDYIVFDLDPDEGLSWERVVEGTLKVREKLEGLGLRTWLKTTGGKGLHVCVPITRRGEWDEVKAFTKAVVESIVADEPNRYTSKLPKASRKGKIFIDYLRNGRGATSIGAYSTRARTGAPVSTPLFWEELETDVRANTYTVRNLPERLEGLEADPWADFLKERQSITAAMKKAVGMK